jgi:hypothetical protein
VNPVLAALTARYPRVQWRREGDLYRGVCGSVHFRVWAEAADESSGLPDIPWWADGWSGDGSPTDTVGAPPSPVEALDRLAAMRPEYRAALHAAPVEPARVVEYIPPTEAELATAQTPQSTPFPAMLLAVAWRALWPLVVLGMALACGALGMWWLTGGGQ